MLMSLSSYGFQLQHRRGLVSALEEAVSTVGKVGMFDNETARVEEEGRGRGRKS